MIGNYLTDIVQITNITINAQYGGVTNGTPFTKSARVEDTSRLFNSADGKKIKSEALVILERDISISTGDTLKITKRFGSTVASPKVMEVIEAQLVGGFMGSHLEVYV